MRIAIIVAASENNAIGTNGKLPWHQGADLKFFKSKTIGKTVIMGRKTFESLGKPLPDRKNIVLSKAHQTASETQGITVAGSLNEAVTSVDVVEDEEVFIIGGGKVFEQALAIAERLYITRIHTVVADADTFFPPVDHTQWVLTTQQWHPADDKNDFDYTFQQYDRIPL
jgi:dihydrofolate reductase